MATIFSYLPAFLLFGAIAANDFVVWFGHDAIVAYSSSLGLIMLLGAIGCLFVIIRAVRISKLPTRSVS